MNGTPVCPCDEPLPTVPTNLPGLSHIAFRVGAFLQFRQALLLPLPGETQLSNPMNVPPPTLPTLPTQPPIAIIPQQAAWRPGAAGDLAVMMMEWWAYVADVLTFYNELIANQNYLRTANVLPESVPRLIALLGYRPRPAIGATGILAALITPGRTAVLPRGLQFQSKPVPGQTAQTFELDVQSAIGPPDAVPATLPVSLLALAPAASPATSSGSAPFVVGGSGLLANQSVEQLVIEEQTLAGLLGQPYWPLAFPTSAQQLTSFFNVLVTGSVTNLNAGAQLLLVARDPNQFQPQLTQPLLAALVGQPTVQTLAGGGKQTRLTLQITNPLGIPLGSATAAQMRLQRATQSTGLWTFFSNAFGVIADPVVQLAGLARQLRPGDPVVLTAPDQALATTVTQSSDVTWFSNAPDSTQPTVPPVAPTAPLPVPHTQLTLANSVASFAAVPLGSSLFSEIASISVLFNWVDVGVLMDQPPGPFSGSPPTLLAVEPATFAAAAGRPVIVADSTGAGVLAVGSSAGDGTLTLGDLPVPIVPALQPPLQALYNLLPVSRGKTVANEILGSGDATAAGQSFQLSQSPVTYLAQDTSFASTIAIQVSGRPWLEVSTFFGQSPTAEVFVTREDESGNTHVDFGDGLNGARLPTGTNNIVATYRMGAGAASPPAGKLTVVTQSFPGLKSVLNPVPVGGGADPDPPARIAQFAPRSVLTFGRAVSVYDYQALALQAPGVARVQVVWAWSNVEQRTVVTVYVGDDSAALASAAKVLLADGDPNRPVSVVPAIANPVAIQLALVTALGMDPTLISNAATAALTDPTIGLFAAANAGVGQSVYNSQIEASVLAVAGAVAIAGLTFSVNGFNDGQPVHSPGEGGYFGPVTVTISTQVANG